MNVHSRDLQHLAILVAVAALSKVLIFDLVAVNGDTGLYLYDAKQLLWGSDILVDYPSRSPLMEYLLAGVVAVADSPIAGARTFMLVISLLVGVAIYALARELHSHRAGLAAAALWYLTPLSLVWSLWVKTEPVAALVLLTALWMGVRGLRDDRVAFFVAMGVLFGVAFLIRRVAIVHIGAFGLFALWWGHREEVLRSAVTGLAAGAVATVGTMLAAYATLAGFDPGLTVEVTRTHAVALVESSGQGSLGWVGLEEHTPVLAENRDTLLATVCQKCGIRTFEIFKRTWRVTLPLSILLLVALRSYVRRESRVLGETVLPAALGAASLFGAGSAALSGALGAALPPLVFGAGVGLVWWVDSPDVETWWRPGLALPVLTLVGLTAGYLYRDRILYVTYFQDLMPFVAILAGVCVAALWPSLRREQWQALALAVVLAASLGTGLVWAYPLSPDTETTDWVTIDQAQEYGDMMDDELARDERLLTAQPLYGIESDRLLAGNLSRRYYAFRQYPNSNKANETEAALVRAIESGQAPLAINDTNMHEVIDESSAVGQRLEACYEPVNSTAIQSTGGQLLVYQGCQA